jgi:hypothetical protein
MKRIEGASLCGILLLWMTPVLAQTTTPARIDDAFHDGWYFRGSTRADAQARIAGHNGTALVVDCKANTPRVTVFFRDVAMPSNALMPSNPQTTRNSVKLTFHFLKRSITSWITSYFDKDSVQDVLGEQIASGMPGLPASIEHVNFTGTQASTILTQLKSMDSVSAGAVALGQPVTFDLNGAGPVIDQVLAICSSGP